MLPVIKFRSNGVTPASARERHAPWRPHHPCLAAVGRCWSWRRPVAVLFVALHLKAMRNEILRRRVKTLQQTEVERASRPPVASAAGIAPWISGRTPLFIWAAYAAVAVVLALLLVWLVVDGRAPAAG